MSAKSVLSGEEKAEASKGTGSGTKVSGYTDDPTPKRCNTCEYFVKPNLCNNKVVSRDPKLKKDSKTKFKIISPVNGCCSFWEPEDDD